MFSRFIDGDLHPLVRGNFDALVWARLVSNSCYRFAPPFIAVIARGLDVSVADLGIALMVAEFAGLLSPFIGRRIDGANRLAAMAIGMMLLAFGTFVAAASASVVMFACAVLLMNASKIAFDTALIVWINDHVPYERRGRVVGVVETSWALGLFVGVSAMGIVTAVWSWRAGLFAGGVAMLAAGARVVVSLPRHEAHPPAREATRAQVPRTAWFVVTAMFTLMGASQAIGITFGPWFEDDFGFSSGMLVAIVILLGVAELLASTGSARKTDSWGKERSVVRGCVLMLGTTVAMLAAPHSRVAAVVGVVLFMLGFEFAVVSILPLAANIVPGASGVGLGLAVGAGTTGRAVLSATATRLYESRGAAGSVAAGALLAAMTCALISAYARLSRA